ncbi:MAG: ATP-binding protein [Nanoarchaeota archaeon]|nr:ATP-binding protein [Nanoarchaeota archaeon]MBU1322355.1 ATP-binding protein [Nanoarchaeota archaeon]MBU1596968.1 ATP-binding protein [Nanoarchaeota archaeon]MBU2441697.1 ATP-binding protein [Nanoarchaeota archaeon]
MVFENLKEWNIWWAKGNIKDLSGINREKTKEITNLLSLKQIKTLAGIRRSGKSTILYQIIEKLLTKAKPENILFINMEDEALLEADFDKIIESYFENVFPEGGIYLFIDEIQHRNKWEFWVKTQYDLKKFKQIFISGSSSSLLLSDYASLLTGRQLSFLITPLSFKEFLSFKKFDYNLKFITKRQKAKIKALLKEYLMYGGFPEVVLEKEKHRILVEYYNNIIDKDIIARYNLEERKVKDLARYILSNISSLHSYKRLASLVSLSPTTVTSYLNYIENAFLITQVPIFSYKIKDHLQYPRKIYCADVGLANIIAFQFSSNLGKLYENLVFLELKRKNNEIYYWKSKQQEEVDFVIKKGLKIKELIQVCYNLNNQDVKKREIKALLKAMNAFKIKKGLIITDDFSGEEEFDNKKIIFKPLWLWLLQG